MTAKAFTGPITIDPITRIEGHLKIDVDVKDGKVANAWSSAQLFRGIEMIVQGRPPEDVHHYVQRVCGVCTTTHALTSIRAVENAIGLKPPPAQNSCGCSSCRPSTCTTTSCTSTTCTRSTSSTWQMP